MPSLQTSVEGEGSDDGHLKEDGSRLHREATQGKRRSEPLEIVVNVGLE
jgi:hypothetical protein